MDVGADGAFREGPARVSTRAEIAGKRTTYNTHSFVCSNHCRNADYQWDGRKGAVASRHVTERHEDAHEDASNDGEDAEAASEDDAWTIAIADCPADEVRVSLAAKRPFDADHDLAKSRRVRRVRQSAEERVALARREVELASTAISNVDGNYTGDLFAIWLDSDCAVELVIVLANEGGTCIHGWNFSPAVSKASLAASE